MTRHRSPFRAGSFAIGLLGLALGNCALGETLLVSGCTVHPVAGPAITNGAVLVKDGRIEAIGPGLKAKADRAVRLDGQHLFPGLIALSCELGLVEIDAVRATRDTTEVGDYMPDVRAWIAVNPDSELIPVARANGITHALPVPAGGIVAGQSGLVALDGWTIEQMTIRQPVALHVYWPSQALDLTPKELARDKSKWKSLEEQAKQRRVKLEALEDFFEEARAYARARESTNEPPEPANPAWEAMLPYAQGKLPLMVHANELRQIKQAVEWASAHHWKICLVGGRDAWMLAKTLADKSVPVIYEHVFALAARDTAVYDAQFHAPAILHEAGVQIAFGYGGAHEASAIRNLPYEAAQAVAFGLPIEEALRALTLYPAQMAGVGDRLGSLEVGKEATFFAADGHILDLRSRVRRLWIAGQEVDLSSRHTRLYEKYRRRPLTR